MRSHWKERGVLQFLFPLLWESSAGSPKSVLCGKGKQAYTDASVCLQVQAVAGLRGQFAQNGSVEPQVAQEP